MNARFIKVALGFLLLCGMRVDAQVKKPSSQPDLFDLMQVEKKDVNVPQVAGVALESPVNPERYFIGPSDIIAVNIWVSPPQSYPLTVTPEGTLIIPMVGEVHVSDMTLAKAKEKILSEIRKKYINVEVTATLVKPRPIIVSVIGKVMNPGLYTVTAVDRANKVIEEANKPTRMQDPKDLQAVFKVMSERNIVVKHRDGTEDRADLKKYYATREEQLNPYLREGDIIVVPSKEKVNNVVAVYGQVNSNGRFEYVRGDSLTDAIRIANGLTERALGEEAIFSRMSEDGNVLADHVVNIPAIMAGKAPNIALEPGDRIIVKGRIDRRGDFNVDVKGSVKFPGTYPITYDKTRLSEIIAQAGGFTAQASLSGARVLRQGLLLEDSETEQMLNLRGGLSGEDSTGFSLENELRAKREAVSVNFESLFLRNDTTQDIVLRGEDQILVPDKVHTVYVFGQVALPGHVPYVVGKDESYYIDKSGGFTDRANKGGMKVVKSATKQWIAPGDTKVEEGDYVWVPTEVERPFGYYLTIIAQSAAILSVAISLGILVSQTKK